MRPFPEVLSEHMERVGIESIKELWARFAASGEKVQRWRFERACERTYRYVDARYIRGVIFALGYEPESEEAARVALSCLGFFHHKA